MWSSLLRCNCHMRSSGSLCILAIVAKYSMNPYVYPTGFAQTTSDAVRARADAVRALEQPMVSLADQYGANKGL